MPLFSFEGKSPRVHPTAFIAPTANLIGDVTVNDPDGYLVEIGQLPT